MEKTSRIFIAGDQGMVGSAIIRRLEAEGYRNLFTVPRKSLDLLNQAAVHRLFSREKIDYVFLAAARVGGIHANQSFPANFLFENLTIACNVIHAAAQANVKKLMYLGSSCIYPKQAPQPIKEEYLLTGSLEPTNEAYALAKIAGLKLCQYYYAQYGCKFIAVMPTNLYGPNDNFGLETSHVLPALIRKFHEAKKRAKREVSVWGSGRPRREFLHVDDLARALFLLMNTYEENQIINIGSGTDISIRELAESVAEVVGYKGRITFDPKMPDGTPRKLLDVSRIQALGWRAEIELREGMRQTYEWALKNHIFNRVPKTVQDLPLVANVL